MTDHYTGLTDRMLSEIKTISGKITHDGEMGRNNGRITITPTESGWTFQGDGSLAGLVKRSGTGRSGGAC